MELKPNVLTAIAIVALVLSAVGAGAGIMALSMPGPEGPEGPVGDTGETGADGEPGFGFAGLVVAAHDSIDNENADFICDGSDDQVQINAAIGSLPAQGGSIYLREGTFALSGNITIARSNIVIKGAGASTVLSLEPAFDRSITAISASGASNVLISDLSVIGAAEANPERSVLGVSLNDTSDCSIDGIVIRNIGDDGINIENCVGTLVMDCIIDNCTVNAVRLSHSTGCRISGNLLRGSGDSNLYVFESGDNIISNNQVQGSTNHGMVLLWSDRNQIDSNRINGSGNSGLVLDTSSSNTVSGNGIYQSALSGIYGLFGKRNTIEGNVIESVGAVGISFDYSLDNAVVGNVARDCGWYGLMVSTSSGTVLSGNTVSGAGLCGIFLFSSDTSLVSGNAVSGSNQDGIRISSSSDNVISGNTVSGNSQSPSDSFSGIYIQGNSDHNLIDGNSVRMGYGAYKQRYGVYIGQSSCGGNLVVNNDLYYAGLSADFADDGTGTEFHNNMVRSGWIS